MIRITQHSRVSPKTGLAPLYVTYTYKSTKMPTPTGIKVRPDQFVNGVVINHPDAESINLRIETLRAKVNRAINEIISDNMTPTTRAIKTKLDRIEKSSDSVGMVMDRYLEFIEAGNKSESLKKATRHNIVMFKRYAKRKPWKLSDFNEDIHRDMIAAMQDGSLGRGGAPLADKTVIARMSGLYSFLKWAFKNKYTSNRYYRDMSEVTTELAKNKGAKKPVLNNEEVLAIYEYAKKNTISRKRAITGKMHVLCHMTAQRVGDVINLRYEDIIVDNGRILAKFTAQKTGKVKYVKLNYIAREIVGDPRGKRGLVFPGAPSIDAQNRLLKSIAKAVGIDRPYTTFRFIKGARVEQTGPIWQFISTHCGRHGFAARALKSGMSMRAIQKLLDHSSVATTELYVRDNMGWVLDQQDKMGDDF